MEVLGDQPDYPSSHLTLLQSCFNLSRRRWWFPSIWWWHDNYDNDHDDDDHGRLKHASCDVMSALIVSLGRELQVLRKMLLARQTKILQDMFHFPAARFHKVPQILPWQNQQQKSNRKVASAAIIVKKWEAWMPVYIIHV